MAALRREFRKFRDSLPTQLERGAMLAPFRVAESAAPEANGF